ncbi:MAG: polysaccharide pyruvyl transferase CsaB [Endomicrobiales bacterium]|jgi:polysaccharide pyruvyl transferase CsaB
MNIVISGYYGFNNAGDELILESIISEVKMRNAGSTITVLSSDPQKTRQMHDVKSIDRWNWLTIFQAILKADILISGGGGLFQDRTGSGSLYYYLAIIGGAKLLGKKVFVYAAGVNNLKRFNRFVTAWILSRVDKITVRETSSRELLQSWGCTTPIEVTADPVLLNDVQAVELKDEQPRIALVLRPPLNGPWPVEIFAKLADSLSQRLDAQIIFVPFYPDKDLPFTLAVKNAMKSPSRIVEWSNFRDLYDVFAQSDMVISQRLHALILSALYGIPHIGISDDPKIDRFLREMGQKNIIHLDDLNHYALLAVILDVWDWRDAFRANARKILPAFKGRAKRTGEILFAEVTHGKTA